MPAGQGGVDWQSLGMFAAPFLAQQFGGPGSVPGPMFSGQSFWSSMQQRQMFGAQNAAISQVSQEDIQSFVQMARGLHRMTSPAGTPFTPSMEQTASQIGRNMAMASPILAMMNPDLLDQMHGARGSAAGMATGVTRGMLYLRDNNQYRNLSDAGNMTQSLFRELYANRASDMNGIRATQAGNMFDEMAQRGLLSGASNPQAIANRMREMSGAVAAVRDLFGANGRPNAPMREIFEMLSDLTQSQSHWMSGDQMQMQVRRAQALARRTSGGINQYRAMVAAGGEMAESIGLNRAFGAQAAEASTAFGIAFRNVAGNQGFGGLSADRATALDQQLRLSAARSGQANAFGALMAMHEQGLIRGGPAADLVRAIQNRDQQALAQFAGMDRAQMMGMLAQSGVSAATAASFLSASSANQEQIHQYGIADLVRGNQAQGEARTAMLSGLQSGMVGVLQERGFDAGMIRQFTSLAAEAARRELMAMPAALRSDPQRRQERNQRIAAAISQAVGPMAVAQLGPDGMQNLVASAIRSLEGMIGRDPRLQQFGNLNSLISMMSGAVQSDANAVAGSAAAEGNMGSLTAGLGQGSPLSNAVAAISGAGDDTRITDIIASALGVENNSSVVGTLAGPMSQLSQTMQAYRALSGQLANASPEQRAAIQAQMAQLHASLQSQVEQINTIAEQAGIAGTSGPGQAVPPGQASPTTMFGSLLNAAGDLLQYTPFATRGPATANAIAGAYAAQQAGAAMQGPTPPPTQGGTPGNLQISGTLTLNAGGTYDLVATTNGVNTAPSPTQ